MNSLKGNKTFVIGLIILLFAFLSIGSITTIGNTITAQFFSGDGSNLTSLPPTNLTNFSEPYAYLIYSDSTTIYALNGTSQAIDYTAVKDSVGTNFVSLMNNVFTAASPTNGVNSIVYLSGSYNVSWSARMRLKNNVSLIGINGAYLNTTGITIDIPIWVDGQNNIFKNIVVNFNGYSTVGSNYFVYIDGANSTFEKNQIHNAGDGIGIALVAQSVIVKNNQVHASGTTNTKAAVWTSTTQYFANYSEVSGNEIWGGWFDGIYPPAYSVINGNYIHDIGNPATPQGTCIYVTPINIHATITHNRCRTSYGAGLDIDANSTIVSNNQVWNASKAGIAVSENNSIVSNNVVWNNNQAQTDYSHAGIELISFTTNPIAGHNIVSGNTVYDDQATKTQNYSIMEYKGSGASVNPNYNILTNNIILPSKNGSIYVTGANTVNANNVVT